MNACTETELVAESFWTKFNHSVAIAVCRGLPAPGHASGKCALLELNTLLERVSAWPQVVAAATAAAEQLGASHARLVSRAYHDALFMAQVRRLHPCLPNPYSKP